MAVGLTLIFGVMRVVNFAHGDMMVWGMYLAFMLATRLGLDPYAGFPLCAVALFALGFVVQRRLVNRIIDAPHEMQILLMLGIALVLENGALVVFGPDPRRVKSFLALSTVWLGPLFVDVARLVTFLLAGVLTGLLSLFLFRTDLGRSMRAAADNPYGAAVIGPDVRRVYAVPLFTLSCFSAYLGQAWNSLGGYAGQLSAGHAAFVGIGAYVTAVLSLRLGLTPWIGMFVGAAAAALLGAIIGYLGFRFGLRGFYFVLLTVAFAEVCRIIALNTEAVGGAVGLYITFTGNPAQFQFQDPGAYYYVALVLMSGATAAV